MKRVTRPGLGALAALLLLVAACGDESSEPAPPAFTGSLSCRPCHERFYELWAPSHHGTAMQPFTSELATTRFTPQAEPLEAAGQSYLADLDAAVLIEDPEGARPVRYPIVHAMGGKNVFYLLTPLEKGRLQVLPVAYHVREKRWYDTTASMVRHAAGGDGAVDWKDPLLTFNTACWSCHVSQLSVGYDRETDTYHSTWREPGINCETCHGPGEEHVRVCREAPEGTTPDDLKILRVTQLDHEQRNDTCASCHAKAMVITDDYQPGDRFFDHFDLVCLENADYYPDGRDLGENYTFTSWRMSPCARSGTLDCVHCHTSSGRTRFVDEASNQSCLPCHEEHVSDAEAHSHHAAGTPGSRCVSCHMPMTEFAHMLRSDHSMRPPAPRLSERFGSPNACNLCHTDRDAAWADEHVRSWRARDYQAPMLHEGELVDAARREDWADLPAMLAYVASEDRDEVVATSLIRLLAACPDPRKVPVFVEALGDPSPLVRSAAAVGLEGALTPATVPALFEATGDSSRLVRIRAAWALAPLPPGGLQPVQAAQLASANEELEAWLRLRPDDWSSWYNLGNLHERRGDADEALAAYEQASRLRPDVAAPFVNASMVHARRGHAGLAENALRKALAAEPDNVAAHYNLGLLLADEKRLAEARTHLEHALDIDPRMPGAAYNLGLMVVEKDLSRGLDLLGRAHGAAKNVPRYAWAYAFHLRKGGRMAEAVRVLTTCLQQGGVSADLVRLLGVLHHELEQPELARAVFRRAAQDPRVPERDRAEFRRAAEEPEKR